MLLRPGSTLKPMLTMEVVTQNTQISLLGACTKSVTQSVTTKEPPHGRFLLSRGIPTVELLIPRSGEKPVVTKSYHQTHCRKVCHRCGFLLLKDCCHTSCQNIFHYSMVHLQALWCAAVGLVDANSGMFFGGICSSTEPGPVTGSQSCPR